MPLSNQFWRSLLFPETWWEGGHRLLGGRPDALARAHASGETDLPIHHQLIGERLYINCIARFLVCGAIVGGSLFARHAMGMRNLPLEWLAPTAALLFACNLAMFLFVRRYRDVEMTPSLRAFLVGVMNATIVLDYVFLTAVLWFTGGAQSPVKVFYLVHVIVAVLILPPRMAAGHALLGYLMFAAVVLVEWRGWLPGFYPEGAVAFEGPANPRHLLAILLVQGMWIVVTLSLLMGLVRRMRLGEASLRKANQEVRRFSEMQSNFSRVTIHDLKAPAAAAQSFLNNLRDGLVGELTDKQRNLVEGALRRLEGQMVLLRDFEIMAALDSVSMEKQSRELDLAVLLKGVVLDNQDMAGIHRHDLRLESSEDPPPVRGIEPLLRESVANFVTNAIKYTPEGGKIRVRVRNLGERVRVEVEDNGIGVSEEDRKKLFQEFVRLRRKDAPPREGSGLGLSIVSRIMDMHGGKAGCDSVLNQGSIFWLELPVAKKPN